MSTTSRLDALRRDLARVNDTTRGADERRGATGSAAPRHTPGPWEPETLDNEVWITGPDRNAPVICDMVSRAMVQEEDGTFGPAWTEEDDANVALIASSPDLLAALQGLLATCPCDPDINAEWLAANDAARAAVKRATTV